MPTAQAQLEHRVALIAASIHWTHCEHVIELKVTVLDGGLARVECVVTDFGDYWQPHPTPRTASLPLVGTLTLTDHCCRVSFDEGPLSELSFDPRVPRREVLFGPGLEEAPPGFCAPLLEWAARR